MSDISYIPLFRTLARRKIKLLDLHKHADLAFPTLAKLKKNQSVSLSVLRRIAGYLGCNVDNIITFSSDPHATAKKFEVIINQPISCDYEYTLVVNTPVGRKTLKE